MEKQLDSPTLKSLVEVADISTISLSALAELVRQDSGIQQSLPDGVCQIDPRNGDRIVYVSQRAARPHDNRPEERDEGVPERPCPICQGTTTGVVDVAALSEGHTFINKNLFPVVYPTQIFPEAQNFREDGIQGLHFLQWTSSFHERDFHNIPTADCVIVMQRLAALEKKLLEADEGHVLITKNYGYLVGGSLFHGHQQIVWSNQTPRRFLDNERFERDAGESFASYMLRENPPKLIIKDYGTAVLLVPYFMRRPFDMMLIMKDTTRRFLYELDAEEITAVAQAWQDGIRVMRSIMPAIGRELAYNVITNNGLVAGLYFEFLPYTQEIGGYEQLGFYACQADPYQVANQIRTIMEKQHENSST
jgi:galactose-1-phosphate uridylyltransferase